MKESRKKLTRREFLRSAAVFATAMAATACTTPTPQVITQREEVPIEVTRVVEVAGEKVVEVEQIIVTATAEPAPPKEKAADVFGVLPRSETLIAGILTGRVGSPSNFNEWVGWKSRDRGIQNLSFEPLWTVDFASGQIINSLADGDAIYNDDFTRVEIPLRKGVAWNDGTPFTAADVVYTVELLMATEGMASHTSLNQNVASVSAPNDYTVVFELLAPNSRFHQRFLDRWGCTYILPKHIFEKVDDPLTFEFNPPIACGPYKLHSYDEGGYWTIWEKREDWDKSPAGILFGEPKPKYVVIQAFANEGAKIVAQLTHQLDAVDLSSEGLKAVLSQAATSRAYQPTFPWVVNNDPCITGLSFNTALAPFDNVDVRWALTLAIEIGEYVGQAVDGSGTLSPVCIPSLGSYPENFIKPMEGWLKDFTLDLGNGETFKPYDPDAPQRVIEYARGRGYIIPDDPVALEQAFGIGWYKYAPEAAEKLLVKNGFSKNADGKWLLPNGTAWKIEVIGKTDTTHLEVKNANAAVQQWKRFGIDAIFVPSDAEATLQGRGEFMVSGGWPASEPWGAGVDLHKTFNTFKSDFVRPIGEDTSGHRSRWSSPEMDAVIEGLEATNPANNEATIALGIEGLKLLVENLPGVPTFGYIGFLTWDDYYWTNWPGSENPYISPYTHWGPFKYMMPNLQQTGR